MIFPPYTRPPSTLLDVITDFVMLYAAVMVVLFAVSYASFFNWRKTPAGKAIMYFALSLCAVFALIVAGKLFGGDYPFREWVRFAVYGSVAAASTGLVITLWRNWKRGVAILNLERRPHSGPIPLPGLKTPAGNAGAEDKKEGN